MKLQPTTNPLILKDSENEFFTSTRIIADNLSDRKETHVKVNTIIEILVTELLGHNTLKYFEKHSPHQANASLTSAIGKPKGLRLEEGKIYREVTGINGDLFYLSTYRNSNKRLFLTWFMNERAYIKLIMRVSGYKNALIVQDNFTTAFFLMRDIIQNTPKELSMHKPVIDKNFGKLSTTGNGCGRVEEVRGYVRSSKDNPFSVLFGERTRLISKLGGFFNDDILERIKEVEQQILDCEPVTKYQEKQRDRVLNEKLIK